MERNELKEIIKAQIITSIRTYINKKREPITFHPLDYLIAGERRIRSKVGGLETSLGQTFWEKLAKKLAQRNGFRIIEKKLQRPSHQHQNLAQLINTLIEDREKKTISAMEINDRIKVHCQRYIKDEVGTFTKGKSGIGVDLWLYKDETNYLYDIKTVQPNMAKFKSLFEQLVDWYGCFYSQFPTESVECRIVFPYNPYQGKRFWDNCTGKGKPLEALHEGMVGDEFWDHISGQDGTGKLILDTFKEIAEQQLLKLDFEMFLKNKV